MRFRDLRSLTTIVTIMVIIDALWSPVVATAALLFPDAFAAGVTSIADSAELAPAVFKLATFIVFGRWIYVAGRNVIAAGCDDLQFTPAARIWWFAIPIANLFKPFQGMRELWNASHETHPYSQNGTIVSLWWAAWLLVSFAGGFIGVFAGANATNETGVAISSALDIALATVAIVMIRRIAAAQAQVGSGGRLSQIFA